MTTLGTAGVEGVVEAVLELKVFQKTLGPRAGPALQA